MKLTRIHLAFHLIVTSLISVAQSGKSLVLDGRSNYLTIADHPDFDQIDAISIEAWINPNCIDNVMIVSKQWCSGEYAFYLSVRNGKLRWSFSNTGFCSSTNLYETNNAVIPAKVFTHVAVVHTQSSIKLFINGVEEASSYISGSFTTIRNSAQPFRIGTYYGANRNTGLHYSGLIDELRFWKTELTSTQISQRMNTTLTGTESDLVVYLDMEENGAGNTLQLTNKSSSGGTFNPTTQAAATNTPYCALPIDYRRNNFELTDTIRSCNEGGVTIDLNPTYYTSINWSDGTTSPTKSFTQSGTYWVNVETERCLTYSDTIFFELVGPLTVNQNFEICAGDTLFVNNEVITEEGVYYDTIDIVSNCDTIYQYNVAQLTNTDTNLILLACNGNTTQFQGITFREDMDTTIVLQNAMGCDSIIYISVRGSVGRPFLGEDVVSCEPEFTLNAPSDNTIWSTGESGQSITITETGTYFSRYLDGNGCEIFDTISITMINGKIFVPNAFTPNQDLTNDCFKPVLSNELPLQNYSFKIFNRWGQMVFTSDNSGECWDGQYMNEPAQIGAYMWYLKGYDDGCGTYIDLKGTVTLVR